MHNFPFWVGQIHAERLPIWVLIVLLTILLIAIVFAIVEIIKLHLNK